MTTQITSPTDTINENTQQTPIEANTTNEEHVDFKSLLFNWNKIPCMRKSLLQGVLGGVSIGIIQNLRGKSAFSGFIIGFAGTSVVTWNYCRYQWRQSKIVTRNIMLAQSQGADPRLRKSIPELQKPEKITAPEGTLSLDEPVMPKKK